MPFTNYGLDTLVAQEISALSECNAPDLAKYLAVADDWIHHLILNSTFRFPIETKYKPFFFGIIRRVLMALIEYQNGRTVLLSFLSGNKKNISLYFYALSYFEISVNLLYQAYEYGICTSGAIISFTELADIMEEYINIANSLSNLQLGENTASDRA